MKAAFTKYDAIELAQETAFIRWVRAPEGPEAAAWEAWLSAHPEQQATVAEARRLVELMATSNQEGPTSAQAEGMWAKIDAATEAPAQVRPLWQRPRAWMSAAAAIALLLLAGWWLLLPGTEQVLALPGEQTIYELPDGSRVFLNAGTELSFSRRGWPEQRRVQLSGEAFFEVVPGGEFTVEAQAGSVQVLGTSFNVQSRSGSFSVDCYTGKVRVTAEGQAELLSPGQGVRLEGGLLGRRVFEGEKSAAWRSGTHYFDAVPLADVFQEVERQYGIQVDYPAVAASRQYSGFFESGKLDEALQAICWPMGLSYERVADDRVLVK